MVYSRDLWQLLAQYTNSDLPFISVVKGIDLTELKELAGLEFRITMPDESDRNGILRIDDDQIEIDMKPLIRFYELTNSDKFLLLIRSDGFVECILRDN